MSKFILSKAMGNIPDDMLMEAMEVKKRTDRKWIIRVAACLAVVIGLFMGSWERGTQNDVYSMSGVLKVYAYDTNSGYDETEMVKHELLEGVDTSLAIYIPSASILHGVALTFEVDPTLFENTELSYEVFVNGGDFRRKNREEWTKENAEHYEFYVGIDNRFQNGETIYWMPGNSDRELLKVIEDEGGIFADIIVRAGDHLVGYIVIEIFPLATYGNAYAGALQKSICFPMVNGEFQDISEKFIWEQISQCHRQENRK